MGIIWAPSMRAAAILAIFGIAAEIGGRLSIGIGVSLERRKAARRSKWRQAQVEAGTLRDDVNAGDLSPPRHVARMIPAINIEHVSRVIQPARSEGLLSCHPQDD